MILGSFDRSRSQLSNEPGATTNGRRYRTLPAKNGATELLSNKKALHAASSVLMQFDPTQRILTDWLMD
jgi:hypothetical protein